MSGETKPARIPALAAMPANADGARRPVLRCSHRPGWVDESGDHGRERVLFDSEFTAFNLCFTAVLSFDRGGGERHLDLSLQPGGLSSYELECGGDAMELAGQTGELAMWLADVADVADYLRGEYPDAIVDM